MNVSIRVMPAAPAANFSRVRPDAPRALSGCGGAPAIVGEGRCRDVSPRIEAYARRQRTASLGAWEASP